MFRTLLSLILATGVGVGAAYAQDTQKPKKHRPTAEEKFKQLNKAGDGKLTLKEFLYRKTNKDEAESAFKAADKGDKGYLTLDEFKTIYDHPHRHHRGHGNQDAQQAPEKPADKTPNKTPPGT